MGFMSSVSMCREQRKKAAMQLSMRLATPSEHEEMKPPLKFKRNHDRIQPSRPAPTLQSNLWYNMYRSLNSARKKKNIDSSKFGAEISNAESIDLSHVWQCEEAENLFRECESVQCETESQHDCLDTSSSTHRDHPLLPGHGQDGVVTSWSPGSGVDEKMNHLIGNRTRRQLSEHDIQIDSAKDLLQRVESEPAQLALDEVGTILHDSLQLHVPVPALPPRDEVEHVGALSSLALLPAGVAGESDTQCGEDWEICSLISHSEESGKEIDFAGDSRNGEKACRSHD